MEPVSITYRIKLSAELTETFAYDLDADSFEIAPPARAASCPRGPNWATSSAPTAR